MTRAQIEASLRRDPDDERSWSVFGDLLAAEGDSRGELIALEQRAAACERPFERQLLVHQAEELRQRDYRAWLGPLADAGLELTWLRGFLRSVVVDRNHAATLSELGYQVVGLSKDSAASHCKFIEKYDLTFPLLTDADGKYLEAIGAWGEKKMYGRTSFGIKRSTFVADATGKLIKVYPNVRAKGHAERVVQDLG